jgi:hypothetical protein
LIRLWNLKTLFYLRKMRGKSFVKKEGIVWKIFTLDSPVLVQSLFSSWFTSVLFQSLVLDLLPSCVPVLVWIYLSSLLQIVSNSYRSLFVYRELLVLSSMLSSSAVSTSVLPCRLFFYFHLSNGMSILIIICATSY